MFAQSPIVVSACLAGIPCRYNGKSRIDKDILDLLARGKAIPLCAEVIGGLPTPRPAAEIVGGDGNDVLNGTAEVKTVDGKIYTEEFLQGAKQAADIAESYGVQHAILQSLSPSCGCGQIYDGTFTGQVIAGDGVFSAELKQRGIAVKSCRGKSAEDKGE
ncbi:DUF523 domain-containing protein [uncultured Rothia sp.]|uniref:DUF523 domain-containing protein n=1 Tax=uncultured Rothia sp. TaxID=316088 RepID=UPI0032167759